MRCPLLLCWAAAALAASAAKPDILFILADDLGYNEMAFMNSTRGLLTPHLDTLAHSGVTLKNYYVQPICSPTRSALMTGRYPLHLGTQASVIYWDTPWGIALDEVFLPELAKTQGYTTGMYGKWHLGMFADEYTPIRRGFDHHEGYLQGCGSAYTHVGACCTAGSPTHDQNFTCENHLNSEMGYDWFKGLEAVPSANHTNSVDLIRRGAVEFIKAQAKDSPFLLYLPFQNIHAPYTCDEKFRQLYEARTDLTPEEMTMFGYITEMDDAVGTIVQQLKDSGRFNNTVVIFSSDNGAPPARGMDHQHGQFPGWIARNYPLRGHKSEIWEGGTKVPGFVSSVDHLPEAAKGTVSEKHFHVTDWLPTIAHLTGADTAKCKALDGFNIWTALTVPSQKSPRTEHVYNVNPLCSGGQAGAPKAGIRIGDLKLLAWCYSVKGIDGADTTGPVSCPAHDFMCDPAFHDGPVLYNVTADPAESRNLAKMPEYHEQMQQLLARLETVAVSSVIPMQWKAPFQGPDYFCANCSEHAPAGNPGAPYMPWIKL